MIDDVMSFVKIAKLLKERGAYKVYNKWQHMVCCPPNQYSQCFDYFFL